MLESIETLLLFGVPFLYCAKRRVEDGRHGNLELIYLCTADSGFFILNNIVNQPTYHFSNMEYNTMKFCRFKRTLFSEYSLGVLV